MEYLFDRAEEFKDIGTYKGMPRGGRVGPETKKINSPISPKENYFRLLKNESPLWITMSNADCVSIVAEAYKDMTARVSGGIDWFGIEWQIEPTVGAGMVKPGTRRLSDIVNWEQELVFPDLEAVDWEADYKKNYEPYLDDRRARMTIILNGWFERLADLTSFDDCLCYLLTEPEAVEAFFTRLTDWHIELARKYIEVYGVNIISIHDDLGTQRSSFISPELYREVLMPHHHRFVEAVHAMGACVGLHSCGNVGNLIPSYIDAGFDYWDGQDNANDKLDLMEKYGDRLAQGTTLLIPEDATDEEAEKIMDDLLAGLGKTARIIVGIRDMRKDKQEWSTAKFYEKSRIMLCGEK